MQLPKQLLKQILKSVKEPLGSYSSLYTSRDLPNALSDDGWTKHLLPIRANKFTGLVDTGILYGNNPTFWISKRWGINKEMNLDMEDDEMISEIIAGRRHYVILTTNGNGTLKNILTLYRSIDNYSRGAVHSPSKLVSYQGIFRQVACGLDHTLALTNSGQVFSSGWGADGQTGNGNEATIDDFAPIVGEICNKEIMQISTCADSCFAIADDGIVFAWGNNEYGQLALNTTELQVTVPQQCCLPLLSDRVVDIASGGAFTCFLTESGSVYCIGNLLENKDQMYLLHGGNSDVGPVTSLHAGLHYVVACCQDVLLVWGHYPATSRKLQPLKLPAPNSNKIHSVSPMLHELVLIMDA